MSNVIEWIQHNVVHTHSFHRSTHICLCICLFFSFFGFSLESFFSFNGYVLHLEFFFISPTNCGLFFLLHISLHLLLLLLLFVCVATSQSTLEYGIHFFIEERDISNDGATSNTLEIVYKNVEGIETTRKIAFDSMQLLICKTIFVYLCACVHFVVFSLYVFDGNS